MQISDKSTWIKLSKEGTFICTECENEGKPLTNTTEGMVEADAEEMKKQLINQPSKVIYGVCDVCGMEYQFKQEDGDMFMEPSNEEK